MQKKENTTEEKYQTQNQLTDSTLSIYFGNLRCEKDKFKMY